MMLTSYTLRGFGRHCIGKARIACRFPARAGWPDHWRGHRGWKSQTRYTCHAEVEAIRNAVRKQGKDLSAATLYTTHEPCILCSYVIRHHRIRRVVIQHAVAHMGGATSAYPILAAKDIPIWGEPPEVIFLT
jgi:tRNA(adenine34) deaminase